MSRRVQILAEPAQGTTVQRLIVVAVLSLVSSPCEAVAQSTETGYTPVDDQALLAPADEDWLMWRRTYDHWGYSPLAQIDRSNVGDLRLAWAWTMEPGKQETTPLVHDGIMFLVQACDVVEALDARDGTRLWEYRRPAVEAPATHACANRNAALYGDRLYLGTHDAFLIALDAHTGELVWERQMADWRLGYHYSGGPQVIKGRVVAGMSGCYHINTGCWISAHDPDTGEEIWRTHTIPGKGEPGHETWGDLPDEERRGGSAWIAPSYDPELDLIYYGTAVPIQWGAAQRGTGSEDVLYTNSTLALDPDTGEIVWYFQHLPSDEWDMDHPFPRIIVETEVAPDPDAVEWVNPSIEPGSRRKVVTGVPGKPGIVWTLDAATGEFLWARPTNRQNVIVGVDIDGRKGIPNPELKLHEIGEEMFVCPGLTGGLAWQATAYSPEANTLYAPVNSVCMNYTLLETEPAPGQHHGSGRIQLVHDPESQGNVGLLTAVDVATGRTKWVHQQRAGFGGSILTTGAGLVFASDDARRFRAFDAQTGDVLWEQILNSTAGGFPVSYMVDGVQYIAIGAGGGQTYRSLNRDLEQPPGGNLLFVFRLP
ncbi:MAG: PQQ-binding-like beta-propeller repeat protein [Gemmatimonas sp.]|nr:PQQ-binding-like beta-propeller repeat protein [Gemmatimonas sp.]